MANRFWVGGTGTWNSSNTTSWSTTSGGAGGASVPGTSDVAIFDGSSGGGTVTVDSPNGAGVVTVSGITAGAFTGTLAFDTNNNNVTASSVSFTGTGARTINMGSGTWTITGTSGTPFDLATTTNLTPTFSNAALVFSANGGSRQFACGAGLTYGALTISNSTTQGFFSINQASTFASITVGSGVVLAGPSGGTTTISGALSLTGTSSNPGGLTGTSVTGSNTTFSVGSASTVAWAGISKVTKAGAGSITATNSLDMGNNSGVSITAPSGGGGLLRHPGMSGGMVA